MAQKTFVSEPKARIHEKAADEFRHGFAEYKLDPAVMADWCDRGEYFEAPDRVDTFSRATRTNEVLVEQIDCYFCVDCELPDHEWRPDPDCHTCGGRGYVWFDHRVRHWDTREYFYALRNKQMRPAHQYIDLKNKKK